MALATTTIPVTGGLGARVLGVGIEMGCSLGGGICLCCCQGVLVLDAVCAVAGGVFAVVGKLKMLDLYQ